MQHDGAGVSGAPPDVVAELMKVNLSFSDMEAERKERLGRWYAWIVSEYINCVSCGTGDFKTAVEDLAAFGNRPEQQGYFELRCASDETIDPERMNEIAYILRIITGLCKDILNGYRIMAILEPMEKVYVLRVRIQMNKDSFRIKNATMRKGFSRLQLCKRLFMQRSRKIIRRREAVKEPPHWMMAKGVQL